jgi:peptide/nickel transport system substrate-binding protein
MVDDAVVLPLFQKPTLLVVASNMVNIRDNATNQGPAYNVQEWGIKSAQ